jgi:hypothetical protein
MTISRHPNDRISVFERLISAGLTAVDGSNSDVAPGELSGTTSPGHVHERIADVNFRMIYLDPPPIVRRHG